MFKKDCYHCIYVRPSKGNLCSILKIKIEQIHDFCCNHFKVDTHLQKIEEEMLGKKDDDGSSKRFILNLLTTFKPQFA